MNLLKAFITEVSTDENNYRHVHPLAWVTSTCSQLGLELVLDEDEIQISDSSLKRSVSIIILTGDTPLIPEDTSKGICMADLLVGLAKLYCSAKEREPSSYSGFGKSAHHNGREAVRVLKEYLVME
jgi:hypothetical protein